MQVLLERIVQRCRQAGRTGSHAAFDFVFPRLCPWCGVNDAAILNSSNFDPALCETCRTKLAPPIEQSCPRCAAPVGPFLGSMSRCIHCRRDRFKFDTAFCLGLYDGALRSACLAIKQPGGEALGAALAGLLWERSQASLVERDIDAVVSVPRYWQHRLWQPHNAAQTLGQALAGRLQAKFLGHILRKVRKTPAQAGLPPTQRRANLRGAFRVFRSRAVADRVVLLVDDILTTGTTANEVSKSLLRAGAKKVVVAVIARGLGASSRA